MTSFNNHKLIFVCLLNKWPKSHEVSYHSDEVTIFKISKVFNEADFQVVDQLDKFPTPSKNPQKMPAEPP